MELDEKIYSYFVKFLKKKKGETNAQKSQIVYLEQIKSRLIIIARALTGKAIEIHPAEKEGGYKNHFFFLPHQIEIFPHAADNLSFYFFRTVYLSVQLELGLNFKKDEEQAIDISRKAALENANLVLEVIQKDYTHVFDLFNDLMEKFISIFPNNFNEQLYWFYGKWMLNDLDVGENKTLSQFDKKVKAALAEEIKTVLKAKAVEEIKTVEVDKKTQEDYVLNHSFEKVETADEFDGGWRNFDGEDQLEDHADALEELQMKYAIRTDEVSNSIYQTDFLENTNVSESAEIETSNKAILYDEWDFKKKRYKENFCKLFPEKINSINSEYFQQTIKNNQTLLTSLRKMLTSVNNKMQQQRKRNSGNEFDIDCVTDLFIEQKSGFTPSEDVFLSNRKKEKDISITLLLDVSLSSDGYADGNRIIDVEKEVSLLFGEILNEYHIDFSIHGFYSKTRNYATFITLKDFEENWNQARYQMGDLQPAGYTRIGVALRHVASLINQRPAKSKWLILLSDGKPNDFDKYEGKYGIEDVKKALSELKQADIHYYALAIEANAKFYLPQMFGANHFQILSSPKELIDSLVKLYEQIKYS